MIMQKKHIQKRSNQAKSGISIEAYASKKDRDDKFYYGRLKCPELLLWMAEAAGVDIEIIRQAEKKPWMLLIKESHEQGMLLGRQLETQFLGIC